MEQITHCPQHPTVSVITVCYNAAAVIEATLKSVLSQDYDGVEFIVVDGGSTDGTKDIISRYAHRIDRFISEPDHGIYDAMNKGIMLASGQYVNFMNAGDTYFSPSAISNVMAASAGEQFIAGIARLNTGNALWTPIRRDFRFSEVQTGGAVNHQSSFISRQLLIDLGLYNTDASIIADDLFFLDAVVFHSATYLPVDVMVANYDCTGVSNRPGAQAQQRERFMAAHLPPRLKADIRPMSRWTAMRRRLARLMRRWRFIRTNS